MSNIAMRQRELTPGELAERAGVTVSALHFYEREGLIRVDARAAISAATTATCCAASRSSGSPSDSASRCTTSAQRWTPCPTSRTPTSADWSRLSERWRTDLDDRITRLQNLRDNLDGCIGCGCLSLETCAIYNYEDALATSAPAHAAGWSRPA